MPTTPYSAAELAEFKTLVEAKLAEARADLELLAKNVTADAGEPLPDVKPFTQDQANEVLSRQRKFIAHMEAALTRIANKTYGICRVTGKPISKERLMQVPHATLCIEARASVLNKKTDTTTT